MGWGRRGVQNFISQAWLSNLLYPEYGQLRVTELYILQLPFPSIPSNNNNNINNMPSIAPKKLRILCFGNSLTAGYCAWGTEHFPYADHLPPPLQKLWPDTSIEIDVAALSGDRVVGGQYLRRLESRLDRAGASQNPYDWVIMMGGTNDLGWGCVADSLYEGLSKSTLFLIIIILFRTMMCLEKD